MQCASPERYKDCCRFNIISIIPTTIYVWIFASICSVQPRWWWRFSINIHTQFSIRKRIRRTSVLGLYGCWQRMHGRLAGREVTRTNHRQQSSSLLLLLRNGGIKSIKHCHCLSTRLFVLVLRVGVSVGIMFGSD